MAVPEELSGDSPLKIAFVYREENTQSRKLNYIYFAKNYKSRIRKNKSGMLLDFISNICTSHSVSQNKENTVYITVPPDG